MSAPEILDRTICPACRRGFLEIERGARTFRVDPFLIGTLVWILLFTFLRSQVNGIYLMSYPPILVSTVRAYSIPEALAIAVPVAILAGGLTLLYYNRDREIYRCNQCQKQISG